MSSPGSLCYCIVKRRTRHKPGPAFLLTFCWGKFQIKSWRRSVSALGSCKFDGIIADRKCPRIVIARPRRGLGSLSKKSLRPFSPSCFQNCKIKLCSMILQFCRCGGLLNAKGHPDGFLSHFSSLRNFQPGEKPRRVCARKRKESGNHFLRRRVRRRKYRSARKRAKGVPFVRCSEPLPFQTRAQ